LADRRFDLVVNLEDGREIAHFLKSIRLTSLFGAYENGDHGMSYTDDSKSWFDMSLISAYGHEMADRHKFHNRLSYQQLIFSGLGLEFRGEPYLVPSSMAPGLQGDVAIAAEAGPVWPMKNWSGYRRLKTELESRGLMVNYLPKRPTLSEHLADIRGHRCIVSGDSLPMHLALGSGSPCVALFNCTSPWEIHDYGILTKVISPLLGDFFYKRSFDSRATTAILPETVLTAMLSTIDSKAACNRLTL
jgi:heptosyltransferase-2